MKTEEARRRNTIAAQLEHVVDVNQFSPPLRRNTVIYLDPEVRSEWSLLEHCAHFCGFTTLHGLADWARSWVEGVRLLSLVFWSFAFMAAFSAAVYGCSAIIMDYFDQPVVISYIVHDSNQQVLPDAVICPFSRFNISFFEANNVSRPLVEYIQSVFRLRRMYPYQFPEKTGSVVATKPNIKKRSRDQNITDAQNAEALDELLHHLGDIPFDRLVDLASFDCNSLIPYCVNITKLYNCCESAKSFISMSGKCVRLRGTLQSNSGFGYGITIAIKVPDHKYVSPAANILHNDGVSLKLAEHGKGLDFDLTFIPNGVHALVPLRATKHEFMSSPGKYECVGQESSEGYSPLQCFDDCFFEKAMDPCKCRVITASNLTYPACTPFQLENCTIPITRQLYKADVKGFLDRCRETCRRPCFYWAYYPTVSYARFPSATLFDYVDVGDSRQDWDRYIILDIFYEKLEYTTIKHYASMTAGTFVANIGGQLGLWIGGSILSILWNCGYHRLNAKRHIQQLLRKTESDHLQTNRVTVDNLQQPEDRNGTTVKFATFKGETPMLSAKPNASDLPAIVVRSDSTRTKASNKQKPYFGHSILSNHSDKDYKILLFVDDTDTGIRL